MSHEYFKDCSHLNCIGDVKVVHKLNSISENVSILFLVLHFDVSGITIF